MEDYAFSRWRDQVLSQVRFAPDRAAICRELNAHYADHVQGLLDCGYEEKLARERSLAAMGDAEEIGRALDRVHKPWLGWLWQGTRCLLLVLLALNLWGLLWGENNWESLGARTEGQLSWEAPPAQALCREVPHGKVWLEVGQPRVLDNGEVHVDVVVSLRAFVLNDIAGHSSWDWMEFHDQEGLIPQQHWDEVSRAHQPEINYVGNSETERQWLFYSWNVSSSPQTLVLDHWPEWVELRYPYGEGGGWSIRKEVGPWA